MTDVRLDVPGENARIRHPVPESQAMHLPFYVSCGQLGAGLFELSDGRFQKIEAGVLAPWCQGYGYLLVERTLADFLEAAEIERVRFEPAIVFDPSTDEEDRSLVRVRVGQFFTPDQIHDLPLDGNRLLTMGDSHIFVSPALKARLDDAGFNYLQFSEGLSGFAA